MTSSAGVRQLFLSVFCCLFMLGNAVISQTANARTIRFYVIVENKPGNNHTLNPSLFKEPGYRMEELIPIAELMRGPPDKMIDQYGKAVREVLSSPDVQSRVAALGAEVGTMEGEAFRQFIIDDYPQAALIDQSSGVKPE